MKNGIGKITSDLIKEGATLVNEKTRDERREICGACNYNSGGEMATCKKCHCIIDAKTATERTPLNVFDFDCHWILFPWRLIKGLIIVAYYKAKTGQTDWKKTECPKNKW